MWIQGRDVWNAWVENNPDADINFQSVDFNQHRNLETINIDYWPFANFHFPTGKKNFGGTTFGEGDVSFNIATFGDGDVSFDRATFGKGNVSFFSATFGKGEISFLGATFGDGDVSFDRATFGKGEVSFNRATFGDGDVSFYRAKFGLGAFTLDAASLGIGSYNFGDATFLGRASFANLINVKTVTSLSFRHASFEKVLHWTVGIPLGAFRIWWVPKPLTIPLSLG